MNSVSLVGRCTRDPEVRYNGELAVAKFSIAIDDGWGEKKKTNYPSVVAFGKTAEFIEKNVSKGKLVAVVGKLQTGSYEKSDGTKVYTSDVVAERFYLLEWEKKGEVAKPTHDWNSSGFNEIPDDDIPFA